MHYPIIALMRGSHGRSLEVGVRRAPRLLLMILQFGSDKTSTPPSLFIQPSLCQTETAKLGQKLCTISRTVKVPDPDPNIHL